MNAKQNTVAMSKASKVVSFFAGLAVAACGFVVFSNANSAEEAPSSAGTVSTVDAGARATDTSLELVAGPEVVGAPELVQE